MKPARRARRGRPSPLELLQNGGERAVFTKRGRDIHLNPRAATVRVRIAEALLVVCSVCVRAIVCEVAYRNYLDVWIYSSLREEAASRAANFKAISDTYMISDPVFGYRFRKGISTYTTAYMN